MKKKHNQRSECAFNPSGKSGNSGCQEFPLMHYIQVTALSRSLHWFLIRLISKFLYFTDTMDWYVIILNDVVMARKMTF